VKKTQDTVDAPPVPQGGSGMHQQPNRTRITLQLRKPDAAALAFLQERFAAKTTSDTVRLVIQVCNAMLEALTDGDNSFARPGLNDFQRCADTLSRAVQLFLTVTGALANGDQVFVGPDQNNLQRVLIIGVQK